MHPRHLLIDATVIMVESAAVVQTQKRHSGRKEDTGAALGGKKRHDLSPWSLFDTVLQGSPRRRSHDKKNHAQLNRSSRGSLALASLEIDLSPNCPPTQSSVLGTPCKSLSKFISRPDQAGGNCLDRNFLKILQAKLT